MWACGSVPSHPRVTLRLRPGAPPVILKASLPIQTTPVAGIRVSSAKAIEALEAVIAAVSFVAAGRSKRSAAVRMSIPSWPRKSSSSTWQEPGSGTPPMGFTFSESSSGQDIRSPNAWAVPARYWGTVVHQL